MDVRMSGFRVEGDWETVVQHARRVSRALMNVLDENEAGWRDEDAEAFGQWDDWRPQVHEETEEVRERTAEKASVGEGAGEEQDVGVREDLSDAGRKLGEAASELGEEGLGEAAGSVGESVGHTARAADTAGRRALRALEEGLYRHVVTSISPFYFDNQLVSANLEHVGEDEYLFEVNVKNDELKQAVGEELEAILDEEEDPHTIPGDVDDRAEP